MKVALYEYNGPHFVRPLHHVVTDAAQPECVETIRIQHEAASGGPVTVEKVAVTECKRPRRMLKWLNRIIERRLAA